MSEHFKSTPSVIKIPWAKPSLGNKEKSYLLDALESTWISGGPYLERFETEFPRRMGEQHGLAVSSGTAALQLAVMILDLKAGDEVIVPGFSFAAPINVVIATGATPIYADVDPETWCIDPHSLEQRITPRTKAVIVVHIYGNVCNMAAIMAIAQRHHLVVIEDAAEAVLSTSNGRYAGTFGAIGCFSFQATKTLTMGEGGFVLSSNNTWIEQMRCMRDHGMTKSKRYWHDRPGFNFRLTNLQASIGCAQLERIDEIVAKRRRVHEVYLKHLIPIQGLSVQRFRPEVRPVVWAVGIRLIADFCRRSRDQVALFLANEGIETRPGFYPFSDMPLYSASPLKNVQTIAGDILLLPSYSDLTDEDIGLVCDRLKKGLA